jgi:hypothetical protein
MNGAFARKPPAERKFEMALDNRPIGLSRISGIPGKFNLTSVAKLEKDGM